MSIRTLGVSFLVLSLLGAISFLFSAPEVLAQTNTEVVAENAGLGNGNLMDTIGTIINVVLGFLGVIFLILVIYAGFVWMTAAGDDKKVTQAKKILLSAVIGLVIVLMSYAITNFIFNALADATGSGRGGNGGSNGTVSVERLSGSLGSGPIRDHYPERNDTNVARNTRIIVTFKEALDPASVTAETVRIYPSASGIGSALTDVDVIASEDLKTFVFDPAEYLGSATADMSYTVFVSTDIRNADGDKIFSGLYSEGYEWSFETGTVIDTEAPTVEGVTPLAGGTYDKNILVQMAFSEPIDPTSSTGTRDASSGFDNITVSASSTATEGAYEISNGYKTITFTPSLSCGFNSCDEEIFCLPGGTSISVNIKAATVGDEPPQADYPYDGVADMAGNSLDGNNDGVAGDAYAWDFNTTNVENKNGPVISSITPNIQEEDVALDQDVIITFSDVLMSSSVNSDNILLSNNELSSGESHEQWYRFDVDFNASGSSSETVVNVEHGTFLESTDEASYAYAVEVTEGLRNQYQNCYAPAEGPTAAGGACAVTDALPYCCNGSPSATACALF